MIDVSNDFIAMSIPMHFQEILVNPHDDMILECALDHLME
jgi:hypothetical protein